MLVRFFTAKPSLAKSQPPSSEIRLAARLVLLTCTYTIGMQFLAHDGSKVDLGLRSDLPQLLLLFRVYVTTDKHIVMSHY